MVSGAASKNSGPSVLRNLPITLVLLLAACGQDVAPGRSQLTPTTQVFSADDRRVARQLSIDARQDLTAYSSPYLRALVCEAAVNRLEALLNDINAISSEQKSALKMAREAYSRRVLAAARLEAKSVNDVGVDRRTQAASSMDRSAELQTGLTCLRELASQTSAI